MAVFRRWGGWTTLKKWLIQSNQVKIKRSSLLLAIDYPNFVLAACADDVQRARKTQRPLSRKTHQNWPQSLCSLVPPAWFYWDRAPAEAVSLCMWSHWGQKLHKLFQNPCLFQQSLSSSATERSPTIINPCSFLLPSHACIYFCLLLSSSQMADKSCQCFLALQPFLSHLSFCIPSNVQIWWFAISAQRISFPCCLIVSVLCFFAGWKKRQISSRQKIKQPQLMKKNEPFLITAIKCNGLMQVPCQGWKTDQ